MKYEEVSRRYLAVSEVIDAMISRPLHCNVGSYFNTISQANILGHNKTKYNSKDLSLLQHYIWTPAAAITRFALVYPALIKPSIGGISNVDKRNSVLLKQLSRNLNRLKAVKGPQKVNLFELVYLVRICLVNVGSN